MQVYKFQTQVKCGEYRIKRELGRVYLTINRDALKESTVHAFSGKNGELLARIFCNLNCDDYEQVKNFYKNYGHIYPTLDYTTDIFLGEILEAQQYLNKVLELSAAIEVSGDENDHKEMLCAMLYFLLFSQREWRTSPIRNNAQEVGIWAFQKRFAAELKAGETVESALHTLLYEYDVFQNGNEQEIMEVSPLKSWEWKIFDDWRDFAKTSFCGEICEFLERLLEDEGVHMELVPQNDGYEKVNLTRLPHDSELENSRGLAKQVLCDVLNRDLRDIKWEMKINDKGQCIRTTTLPSLYSLMMAEISQLIVDRRSIKPIKCASIGCKNSFSQFTRKNKKYCCDTCKNREAEKAYRQRKRLEKYKKEEERRKAMEKIKE